MTAVIEVDSLHKTYGETVAVHDVSFSVNEGEIFGILGANGAGKTTTVECLQGLRRATDGEMRLLGEDPASRVSEVRRRVGSQLQDAALPDRIKVREALALFADRNAVDIDDLMGTWGLEAHAKKAFGDLSGGLRQRLFIALALLNRPEVVFFDELTQGLDPVARREVWDVIRSVRDQGATVVLVTHFMEEAQNLCDRLVVFDSGRIIADGTPDSIVAAHADSATMSFSDPVHPIRFDQLAGVRHITHSDGRLTIEGAPDMVAYVCAALIEHGPAPADLRINQPNLEDAILAIEGSVR